MMRLEDGEKVHGPYEVGRRWRLHIKGPAGSQRAISFASKEEAERVRKELTAESDGPKVVDAVKDYVAHVKDRGCKPSTIVTAQFRLRCLFGLDEFGDGDAGLVADLTDEKCAALYERLTKKVKVDTHRNVLAVAKNFGKWCAARRYVGSNPFERVEPVGRRKRGKEQLRVDEARKFLAVCHQLAENGDDGAIAAMAALLLGLRASEIVERVARDLDDGGRLLWIPAAKTDAGRRTLEVPEQLQPHLKKLAKGKEAADRLFPDRDRYWVLYQVRRLCGLAKVPVVSAHSLRGLHATLATEWGSTGRIVAAALGHTSFDNTTRRHYLRPGTLERVAARRLVEVIDDLPPEENRIEEGAAGN